jgi:cytochrome c-type biogenesis protein CcmH
MTSSKSEISVKLIIFILVAMALTAVATYFATTRLSSPVERDLMSEFKAAPPVTMSEFKAAPPVTSTTGNQEAATEIESVSVMLVGLKQRLEAQPDDVDGWVLLSKSYYHLNRLEEAKAAFEKAKALGYTGNWQPLPRIDSFSQNSSSPINLRDYKTSENINQAGTATSKTGATTSSSLKLRVSLNPALQKELSPDTAVFVFVRSVENPGPPLAVARKTVGELPFEIELNDSHAMIPSRTISSAKNVIAGARISVSGSPAGQPGDYEQLSDSIPADFSETLELLIKDKIQK